MFLCRVSSWIVAIGSVSTWCIRYRRRITLLYCSIWTLILASSYNSLWTTAHHSLHSSNGVGNESWSTMHQSIRSMLHRSIHLRWRASRTLFLLVLWGLRHLVEQMFEIMGWLPQSVSQVIIKLISRSWAGYHSWLLEYSIQFSYTWLTTVTNNCSIKLWEHQLQK